MRKLFLFIIAIHFIEFVTAQNEQDSACIRDNFIKKEVTIPMRDGHRLMVRIQSSWFPPADRNPQKFVNMYECNDSDFQKAAIRIYHDGVNSSSIILPVLK